MLYLRRGLPFVLASIFLIARAHGQSCVWYGKSDDDGFIPTSDLPKPLNTEDAEILKEVCPHLHTSDNTPLTCCDREQLSLLKDRIPVLPVLMQAACPTCLKNAAMLYCEMVCSPRHANFLVPTVQGNLVTAVRYNVSGRYATGLYESCKHEISMEFCDPVEGTTCTVDSLMTALSSTGLVPISMDISLIGESEGTADQSMDATPASCEFDCDCSTCSMGNCVPVFPTAPPLPPGPWDEWGLDGPNIRKDEVFIKVKYAARFSEIFDKDVLYQLMDLQTQISELKVWSESSGKNITLVDVCFTPPQASPRPTTSTSCAVLSVAQYFQNRRENLDKISPTSTYLDHLRQCFSYPQQEMTDFGLSCLAQFQSPVFPTWISEGLQEEANYETASTLILSFILNNSNNRNSVLSQEWEKGFKTFVKSYEIGNSLDLQFKTAVIGDAWKAGQCIMGEPCGVNPDPEITAGQVNCYHPRPAQPLLTNAEDVEMLYQVCPLFTTDERLETCCDGEQVRVLAKNFGLLQQFFGRCPSCYHNLRNMYCKLGCSPIQSAFLNPIKFGTHEVNGESKPTVVEVDFFISEEFAHGMYNSCSSVRFPSSGLPAVEAMCGNVDQCSTQAFLDFSGNTANTYAPFQINFHLQDNSPEQSVMDDNVVPCSEPIDENTPACSCQDCVEVCPVRPPTAAPEVPSGFFGLGDFWIDIMLMAAICFSLLLAILFFLHSRLVKSAKEAAEDGETEWIKKRDISFMESIGHLTEMRMTQLFQKWGVLVAGRPVSVLIVSVLVFGGVSAGLAKFTVTTDPVDLWTALDSTARQQKEYFDTEFSPFYRSEQVIIRTKNRQPWDHLSLDLTLEDIGPVFHKDILRQILTLQQDLAALEAKTDSGETVRLTDICFKPLAPINTHCATQSPLQWLQNNVTNLDREVHQPPEVGAWMLANYMDHVFYCLSDPLSPADTTSLHAPCLGDFGGPVFPWVVLGGFEGGTSASGGAALSSQELKKATAMVITFVVDNSKDEQHRAKAMAWEREFLKYLNDYKSDDLTVTYMAERSIEDELDRQSQSDVQTILISYVAMFVYVAVALGQVTGCERLFMGSKVVVGLSGVLIVLLAVSASLGTFSLAGFPATLIIVEVIPFLVLAVGVDNIFILVQTFQRSERGHAESREEHIGRIVGEVAPSMVLTTVSESLAFFLGALSNMPAVQVFSLYAAVALLYNFFLQLSAFLAIFALDVRRQESDRYDVLCCVEKQSEITPGTTTHSGGASWESGSSKHVAREGWLYRAVENYYAPALLHKRVRPLVILAFALWLFVCGAMLNRVEVGLDQELSVPEDSYVLQHFISIKRYLSVGPPVYFVVKPGLDYSNTEHQNTICGSSGCRSDSLAGQIYAAATDPESGVVTAAMSWLDDYFDWVRPGQAGPDETQCCRTYADSSDKFCTATEAVGNCVHCNLTTIQGRPSQADFYKFFPWFHSDNPTEECTKGGHAAYVSAVKMTPQGEIGSAYFMSYHNVLRTSPDFVHALKKAREISDRITVAIREHLGADAVGSDFQVFPYSVFYVFYEQYLTIVYDTWTNLLYSLAAVFLVTFFLLGFDLYSAVIVIFTVASILMSMLALMFLWDIHLNAIALVNLVVAVGIGVEFCSYTVRAFTLSVHGDKVERAKQALTDIGSCVIGGFAMTDFIGIFILAFSKSRIFQVFYFRMYFGIVLFGALHGLVLLPVLLSYIGPSVSKAKVFELQEQKLLEKKHKGFGFNAKKHASADNATFQLDELSLGGSENEQNGYVPN